MLRWSIKIGFFISISFIIFLFLLLFSESLPHWREYGLSSLFDTEWFSPQEEFGLASMIYGTLIVLVACVCITFPLAFGSAVFMSEILSRKWRLRIKIFVELLAGIPGIVYGLLGLTILSVYSKELFDTLSGNSLLLASLSLSVLSLPSLISLLDDVFQDIPEDYRSQARSLGFSRIQTIVYGVLPYSMQNILSFSLLVFGRAMGDTIAVMLVVGSIDKIPQPWYNILSPGQTISSKLGREAAEAYGSDAHWSALMAGGFVLVLLVFFFIWGGMYLHKITQFKRQRLKK